MTIGIAAAGTGGHVFPALAVAEALVLLGTDPEDIVFFGGDRIEATVVPEAGFELVSLDVTGFVRKLSFANFKVMAGVLRAARTIRRELRARRVTAVLAMGGYVTGPAALAARSAKVPLFLHEQNGVPGLANRWSARLADRIFVAFPAAMDGFSHSETVGNPLRSALLTEPPAPATARIQYGLDPDRPVIGILGGSQGADALNRAAGELVERGHQVLHLAGPDQHEHWTELAAGMDGWVVIPFEREMQLFYSAADLIVARAGALTVSELAATGTPSILVPYPGAAGHQRANAAYLSETGGATVLPQSELARLGAEVDAAMDPVELKRRGAAALARGRPDAAAYIAAQLREAARA